MLLIAKLQQGHTEKTQKKKETGKGYSEKYIMAVTKGEFEELKQLCLAVDADTVVFDNELSPGQQFNLEKLLGRTALDRTAVILDIFGQNAHTLEGKAQVELALLRYRLPRLRRGAEHHRGL